MKILRLILIVFVLLTSKQALAQEMPLLKKDKNKGLFNVTQIGYCRGIGNLKFNEGLNVKNKGYVGRIRTTFGYFLNPNFSLGLGFGLDGIHNPSYNTAPVVLDGRYYLKGQGATFYFGTNIGYSLKFSEQFQKGIINSYNVGRRFIWGKRTHFLLSAGIDFHQIKNGEFLILRNGQLDLLKSDVWFKSFSINAGFLF